MTVVVLVAIVPASLAAAPARARRSATPQDTAPQGTKIDEPRGAWSSATTQARECSRTRRKFWQPDQGWIVRRVISCR